MFDLEQSITAWRQQMRSSGIQTDALLDELESHLREETSRQMRLGAAAPQAFESAVQLLGSARDLHAEFAKERSPAITRWRRWSAIGNGLGLAIYLALQARVLWRAEPSHQEIIVGLMGLAVTLGAACAIWRLAPPVMGRVTNQTVRSWIAVGSGVVGMVWLIAVARFLLPSLVLTPGQFAVVFLWAMFPLIALTAFLVSLEQRQSASVADQRYRQL